MTYEELLVKYFEVVESNQKLHESNQELLKANQKLNETITELNLTISALQNTIEDLKNDQNDYNDKISKIDKQLKKLEKQVNRNSTNSSTPPSKDNDQVKAKRKTKSLRNKSDKSVGGQPGHEGHTAKMSANPDKIDIDIPSNCPFCGTPLDLDSFNLTKKQHMMLQVQKLITEYVRGSTKCPKCGEEVKSEFPKEIINPVNYDSSLPVLMSYLSNYCMISFSRIQELAKEFFHFSISQGTISNYVIKMGEKLKIYKDAIKQAIYRYDLWHVDESGIYVEGKRMWLHTIVAGPYHLLFVHEKRGLEAIKDIGLIEKFRGKLIHDNWISYQQMTNCDHIQCMIHVERTLVSIYEEFQEKECKELLDYIREIYVQREEALSDGESVFSDDKGLEIETKMKEILNRWKTNHLANYPQESKRKKGRAKRDDAIKMIDRMLNEETSEQYYEWIHDFTIPYTNNKAERSFRLQKVKMKVSGTYRSLEGAQASCDQLAFIQTLKEFKLNVQEQLNNVINGEFSLGLIEA